MRITGGEWGGRNLKAPKGDAVRPTQDRVREALFSMLTNEIAGVKFLDLFAGAGTVGLEDLSRGAAHVTFVEKAPPSLACISSNIEMLKVSDRTELVRADALNWIKSAAAKRNFDVAFADPPYQLALDVGYAEILKTLAVNDVVKVDGLFIAEMRRTQTPDVSEHWDLCRDRIYGQSRIALYRRKSIPLSAKEA